MPQQAIDFSKYESQAPPAIDFSKYAQDESQAKPESDGFFLNLAHRMMQNNPITASKGMVGAGGVVQGEAPQDFKWSDVHPSMQNAVKATAEELKRLWPNAGTGVGNLLTLLQTLKAPNAGEVGVAAPFAAQAKAASAIKAAPALTPAEAAEGSTWRQPDSLAPSPLAAQSQAQIPPQQQPGSYPEGIQPRPINRAEILDDKSVEEAMRKDLGLQHYRGIREVGQESAPAPKWQQVAQAKADAVRAQAEAQAQQILTEAERAASTPAKLTKTPGSKSAAAQPITTGLDANADLVNILQRSIDLINAKKGK